MYAAKAFYEKHQQLNRTENGLIDDLPRFLFE